MLATRLSAPLARWDAPNLRLQDALNRALPWLWFPVGPPDPARRMTAGAHALYVVHAYVIARAARLPRRSAWALGTLLSWAFFTGAWDRRAVG